MNRKIVRLFSIVLACFLLVLPRSAAAAPVRVSTVEKFCKAIKPGANIIVEIKETNLTPALKQLRAANPDWLRKHPYLSFVNTGQEVGIVVRNVDGLTISGQKGGTSLSIEDRMVTVLSFGNCSNLTLRDLTLGHTPEQGDCGGDVLSFDNCRNVTLDHLDLYGCGYIGLSVYGSSDCGKFLVKNSVIRDCSSGPLQIMLWNNPADLRDRTFIFDNCQFIGSGGYGNVRPDNFKLSFKNCTFGLNETFCYQNLKTNTTFKNCHWAENDCTCEG